MDESRFQGDKQMEKQEADRLAAAYLKPIFGFALKRCKNRQDAEDLTQDILLKAFRALRMREDVEDVRAFVWTIAHHALSNYYRDNKQQGIGVSLEEAAGSLCDRGPDIVSDLALRETTEKLRGEIAYLSRLQRRIVIAYYYENKKQSRIAEELGIPVGTVKWHLFEAKKELKRGMETMRSSSELRFNPIRFALCGTNGSVGSKGNNGNFFRSALSQNIAYVVWKEPKTIRQIADALGVSPVYVESEAEYLEEYGFLTRHGDRYLCNILLDETNSALSRLHDEMYEKAARIFANELYDALMDADIWDDAGITGGCTAAPSPLSGPPKDRNFFLWALIPYIAALSGEALMDRTVSFEQAATLRPDGGHNLCYASVLNPEAVLPKYFDSMRHWCGPCWNKVGGLTLWQIDSEWSAGRVDNTYHLEADRVLTLLNRRIDGAELSRDEYAYLVERGFLKTVEDPGKGFKAACQCVWIEGAETKKGLLSLGDRIKERHWKELEALRGPYIEAVLEETPKHLRTMQQYGLQFTFYSDGWFILHCLKELVNNRKLKPPAEEQKKALTTIVIHE